MISLINKSFYFASLLLLCFTSCKKHAKYSCDDGLDAYASKMINVNQNILRDELVKHSLDTQMAIFRSLSSVNKKRIFNEKIELLLNTDTTLTEADMAHLLKIQHHFSPSMYNNGFGEEDSFAIEWQRYALDSLYWSQARLEQYTFTWMTMSELNSISLNSGTKDCTCLSTNFGCGIGKLCDKNVDCTEVGGCGFFGGSNCTGLCPVDKFEPISH